MNAQLVAQTCGRTLGGFSTLDAEGTRGGMLLAWNHSKFAMQQCSKRRYIISVVLRSRGEDFKISVVYGPTTACLRRGFFSEIQQEQSQDDMPWIILWRF